MFKLTLDKATYAVLKYTEFHVNGFWKDNRVLT